VAHEPLGFRPGSRYRYSNTDNIVVGLIAERVDARDRVADQRSYEIPTRPRAASSSFSDVRL
jgi:hypothetical protein